MTAALLVAVALLAAVAAFALRGRSEHSRRIAAERHAAELHQRTAEVERMLELERGRGREWLAVLGHELRSPLGAILGYAELLEDGTFGELDEKAADAVHRLRASAEQLAGLLDGMDAHAAHADAGPAMPVHARTLLDSAAHAVAAEAAARDVSITVEDGDISIATRPDLAIRAVRLALGAAIKVSGGGSLRVFATGTAPARIVIAGSAIDAGRDDPDAAGATALTGAGLRIALARLTARQIGGDLSLQRTAGGTDVELRFAPFSIDSAEDRP